MNTKTLIGIAAIVVLAAVGIVVLQRPAEATTPPQHVETSATASGPVRQGYARALMRRGMHCDRTHRYAEAAQWYRMAAQQGLAEAQNNLGVMLKDGQGVQKDLVEAAYWFLLAAQQGNVLAQSNLGWLYQSGSGVEQDYAEARRWYLAAACQGHAAAQNNLGTMYRDGQGVEQNLDSARYWLTEAAAQGMKLAQRNLDKLNALP